MNAKVGVIGVGNMGSALVKGWLRAGDIDLLVWDSNQLTVDRLLSGSPSLVAAHSLAELATGVDTAVVVVKPKDAEVVLRGLRGALSPRQTVVSAMAGLTLEWLREALGPGPNLLRVMPNLAVGLGAGAVAMAVEQGADMRLAERSLELFGRLGLAEILPEEMFDVFTAISGSSPAFLAVAVEGLEDGAVAAGLSRSDARRVVRQAALSVAEQWRGEGDCATSPSEEQIVLAFRAAVTAAMERSRQMSKT